MVAIELPSARTSKSMLTAFIPANFQSYTVLSLNNAGLRELRITEHNRVRH